MQRYFIELAFKGTAYHGWQAQPNASSVQGELEKTLKILLHESVKTTGAGRTDTGVHAAKYIAHFDTDSLSGDECSHFVHQLNALLPVDIAVRSLRSVKPDAHARYSALSRTYRYTLSRIKDPFLDEYSWFCPMNLDLNLLTEAAASLMQFDDFKSFTKLHSDVKTHYCKIAEARWTETGGRLEFTIKADRFLRNMVRAIVGTMVDIGRGKIPVESLKSIVEGRDRNLAGVSAPARGLMLMDIEYPDLTPAPLSF